MKSMRSLRLACVLLAWLSVAIASPAPPAPTLTTAEFEKKVEASTNALRSDGPLAVADAIDIVRLSNTFFLLDRKLTKRDEAFARLLWRKQTSDRLTHALGDSIPNPGMGLYFKKYDLHWGGLVGNIRNRDRFRITDDKTKEPSQSPKPASPPDRPDGDRH